MSTTAFPSAQLSFDDLVDQRKLDLKAAAWSVVADNWDDITRYAAQMAAKTLTIEADELFNEAVATIVERFEHFDVTKGRPTKWCYWQVRRACTNMLREADADRRLLCGMNPGAVDPLAFMEHEGRGDARHLEAQAQAARIMALATPEEAEAIYTKAEGLSGPEVKQRLGFSLAARNQRIYRFRRRIGIDQEKA